MPPSDPPPDALRPLAPLSYFDPEHVDRPVPAAPWRALFAAALLVTIGLTAGWEVYWRGKGLIAGDYKNTSALWAEQRRKAVGDATVIIGSSRIFFGLDLDVWQDATGVRPVQLAIEGTSPRLFLGDLANDESFHGTVFVGVTVPLFFTQEGGLRAEVLRYYKDETPAQRADHILSGPIERLFAFIDEQSRPKTQMKIAPLPLREGMSPLFFPRKLSISEADRNTELWARVVVDERYREEAKAQWMIGIVARTPPPSADGSPPPPFPEEAVTAVVNEVKANIDKIRARGGDVAFFRLPYEGGYAPVEDFGFPRERVWDRLVAETDSVGISFHDHPELQGYQLPEWSHLEAREAERYTAALAPIFERAVAEKQRARAAR